MTYSGVYRSGALVPDSDTEFDENSLSEPYMPANKGLTQHSLSYSTMSDETARSGFGRDSFSTPDGHIPHHLTPADGNYPESLSQLLQKEVNVYTTMMTEADNPHWSNPPIGTCRRQTTDSKTKQKNQAGQRLLGDDTIEISDNPLSNR